jgi:hypothetical protein
VAVGTQLVPLGTTGFAAVNVVLAVAWVALAWQIGRTYRGLTAETPAVGVRRPAPAGA